METQKISAVAVMPHGRLMFAETMTCILRSIGILSHPMNGLSAQQSGPYWSQSFQNMLEAVCDNYPDTKYVLCFDGDSVFDIEDVLALHRIIDTHTYNGKPIDAVFPVQADRAGEKPLAYNWCAPNITYDYHAPWMPYLHGHFGLSFIRLDALRALPKPWFMEIPNSNGTWHPGNGKTDADTYFWMKFNENNRVAVKANQTVIGHIQSGIRWQVGSKVVWQHVRDYYQNGKPYGARCPHPSEYPEAHATNVSSPSTGESIDAAEYRDYSPGQPRVETVNAAVAKNNGQHAPPVVAESLEVNK